jgi:hypothetical protein
LLIFLVGVIGFAILVYNRPTLSNPHVFDGISFPPNPRQLEKLANVSILSIRF